MLKRLLDFPVVLILDIFVGSLFILMYSCYPFMDGLKQERVNEEWSSWTKGLRKYYIGY